MREGPRPERCNTPAKGKRPRHGRRPCQSRRQHGDDNGYRNGADPQTRNRLRSAWLNGGSGEGMGENSQARVFFLVGEQILRRGGEEKLLPASEPCLSVDADKRRRYRASADVRIGRKPICAAHSVIGSGQNGYAGQQRREHKQGRGQRERAHCRRRGGGKRHGARSRLSLFQPPSAE